MSETTIKSAILAEAGAESLATGESIVDVEEMSRCPQCESLCPTSDLYSDSGLCPSCVITNHFEARRRRLTHDHSTEDEIEILEDGPGPREESDNLTFTGQRSSGRQ